MIDNIGLDVWNGSWLHETDTVYYVCISRLAINLGCRLMGLKQSVKYVRLECEQPWRRPGQSNCPAVMRESTDAGRTCSSFQMDMCRYVFYFLVLLYRTDEGAAACMQ